MTPALLFEAADVYDILGDVMGQDTGFGDAAAAMENYQRTIEINRRALAMDPGFMRVRRGLVTMQMKIGNVQLETDPSAALVNFEAALSANKALPKQERERLNMLRLHALLLRKKADALSELGRYDEAVEFFSQSLSMYRKLAASDPKDFRALEDIHRELYDEASSYRKAGDPRWNSSAASRQRSLAAAELVLMEDEATLRKLLAVEPDASRLRAPLDAVRVQMDTVRFQLHKVQKEQATRSALAELKRDAARDDASPLVLELVVTSFLQAQPKALGDPAYAVLQAKRGVELTHHKSATWFLMLAEAYRADGKAAEAQSAAETGISLLPSSDGGGILLESEDYWMPNEVEV